MTSGKEDIPMKALKKLREYYRTSSTAGQIVAEFIIFSELKIIKDDRIVEITFRTMDPYVGGVVTRKAKYDIEREEIIEVVDVE